MTNQETKQGIKQGPWTPEPWHFGNNRAYLIANFGNRAFLSHGQEGITGYWPAEGIGGKPSSEFVANALRAKDCVNALAGIADPAAYVQAVERLLSAIETQPGLDMGLGRAVFFADEAASVRAGKDGAA